MAIIDSKAFEAAAAKLALAKDTLVAANVDCSEANAAKTLAQTEYNAASENLDRMTREALKL